MNGNVIRTITIRGTSEGLDKLQTDLVKLAAAHKNVAIAAEETDKKTLSLEQSWKRQTLRLDEAARAQNNIARETKLADAALREGLATQAEHAKRLELINQRYVATANGAQTYGKALQQGTGEARLARHEMINLSRQIQDVGVSLASGQAPLTVLVQQGSQIADVFATSSGTLKGFFGQLGAGAARFLGSAAGIAGSAASIGVALLAAGSSAASGQRDIEKSLSGIGRASGVTRAQINQIAEASSSAFGISVSEAQAAATAFAATGRIYAANVAQATRLINDYARAGGDAAEVTKTLGEALLDPAKGALELNKSLGFLNAATLEHIRNLQAQGKEQEAQKLLMDKLSPAIQKQAEQVGTWTKAWNLATNAASNYFSQLGKDVLTVGEKMTGANLGGFSPQERLQRGESKLQEMETGPFQGALAQPGIQAQREEVERLRAAVAALKAEEAEKYFNLLGTQALAAANSFLPLQAQIQAAEQALNKLREAELAGAYVNTAALQAGELRVRQLQEQEGAIIRQNKYTAELAAKYPGMTLQTARQLELLDAQLGVANARSPTEAQIANEILRQVQLRAQGVEDDERALIIAKEREIAEANVAKQIAQQATQMMSQLGAFDDTHTSVRNIGSEISRNVTYTWQWVDAAAELSARWAAMTIPAMVDARLDRLPIQFGDEQFQSTIGPLNAEALLNQQKELWKKYGFDIDKIFNSQKDLTKSTDALNKTMQDALSPFYSQDPRTTKLGFRAGTVGNPDWMTGATNENPLVAVLGPGATAPGMANGGSFTVGGGYSANDNRMAVFPVASGEQVVVNRNKAASGGQVVNIDNRIIITGSVTDDALSQMKISRYQQAQRMRAGMARA